MAFLGCDMVYPETGKTHFYGDGKPDPLRDDPSLRNLEAKAARLMLHAAEIGCACVRLSHGESRLIFPTAAFDELDQATLPSASDLPPRAHEAREREDHLGYRAPSGRYWEAAKDYDGREIDALDQMWLGAAVDR